ncbi:hypothetical protein Ngar_c15370 [Candidatus Nitrososphaera gargensis Ga9.2]|uniref:Uncharacterized protein n=1 Tax=Nitrososphaera gargensis (strain Ga9.2) TaxID=1237085 RepID=K0IAW2_NITGG|nr:hypothetical protein [Candidatus Nitrososphaera gargensis]AFU58471.1 hypothetical protein Ngar_c15370 [Candidatus Nitrososphaera gargensis Ga9.2]
MYHLQKSDLRKKKASEALAIVGMALLTIDTAGTLMGQGGNRFLPLTDRQSGILLGLPSIILLFLSFGIVGLRQKIRITTVLLMAGGAMLAVSKLIEPTMGLILFLAVALPYVYVSLIASGFILIGLGLLRAIRRQ